jgi:hypothetical protein
MSETEGGRDMRPTASDLAVLLLLPLLLGACVTQDMVEGRRWPGDRQERDHHDRDYADRYCEGVINSDDYIDCRRKADDARRLPPDRRRDPGGLPATPD